MLTAKIALGLELAGDAPPIKLSMTEGKVKPSEWLAATSEWVGEIVRTSRRLDPESFAMVAQRSLLRGVAEDVEEVLSVLRSRKRKVK